MNPVVEQFDAVFAGRRDVYATGYQDPTKPEKYRYQAVYEDLTPELLLAHMKGEVCIGVYPIVDNKVAWFAIDFDAPKDDKGNTPDDPFAVAWEVAKAQAIAFEKAGLIVYLERSRSGKGVHVWGFLDEPVEASVVRQALQPLLTDHEIFTSRDRMYPVQVGTSGLKEGLGNLIALPFWGKVREQGYSSFLDPVTQDVINPRVWLASVQRNRAAVLRQLADEAPQDRTRKPSSSSTTQTPAEGQTYRPTRPLVGALKVISPYGCQFMRHCWIDRRTLSEPEWYAAIQQATCFRHGLEFAHAISRDYKGYNPAQVDAKYEQALRNPPVGCAWIHANSPDNACDGCPMKAPYHLAKRTLMELVGESEEPMEQAGSFGPDLARVKRFDDREVEAGVRWGIPGLDRYTRLRPGELTVVGAMQSIGKTYLMTDAAYRIASEGTPVFVFSAETGRGALRQRLLARVAEVDLTALRGERETKLSPKEWDKLRLAAQKLEKREDGSPLPLFLDYTSLSADDVLRQVEDTLLRNRIPLDKPYVLFFDYLQFGSKIGDDRTEYDKVSRNSTEFKFLAKVLEQPVVVFSQLVRSAEGDDAPQINWFKNTGRIESDMDVGMIITGPRMEGLAAPRTITFVKQREGRANVAVDFQLQQTFGRYDEAAPRRAAPAKPLFAMTSEDADDA